MYYRKNSGMTLTVPKNYGGNAFRAESDDEQNCRIDPQEPPTDKVEKKCKTSSVLLSVGKRILINFKNCP